MKSLLTFSLVIIGMVHCFGQAAAYNQFNEFQGERLADYTSNLETQTVTQRNKISGTTVVEIYEQGTGRFLGYWGDNSKFKLENLPFIKKKKDVRKLMKSHTIPVSIAIYQAEVIKGMIPDEVAASWGEANKTEDDEETNQKVMRYDDAIVYFIDNKVDSVKFFEE